MPPGNVNGERARPRFAIWPNTSLPRNTTVLPAAQPIALNFNKTELRQTNKQTTCSQHNLIAAAVAGCNYIYASWWCCATPPMCMCVPIHSMFMFNFKLSSRNSAWRWLAKEHITRHNGSTRDLAAVRRVWSHCG